MSRPDDRVRVGVLFGGRSSEHEVSLMSARSVLAALEPERYDVVPIGITREGRWLVASDAMRQLIDAVGATGALEGDIEGAEVVALLADPAHDGRLIEPAMTGRGPARILERPLDVIFVLIHGQTGEDGSLQGLLDLAGVPYVGAGVLGSAIGMDKAIAKALWREAALPVADFLVVRAVDWRSDAAPWKGAAASNIGFPCFVKPANSGSSIGVYKVHELSALQSAVDDALRYDAKVLIEAAVEGRELECCVIGHTVLEASVVGEIVPGHEFYDYEDKYFDGAVRLVIPADLSTEVSGRIQALAMRAFRVLEESGMARVDFFLESPTGEILLNEINTIPGFTEMSMFPRLWEASGVSFGELCDRLIAIAFERHIERQALKLSR